MLTKLSSYGEKNQREVKKMFKKILVGLVILIMASGVMAADRKVVTHVAGEYTFLDDGDVLKHAGTIAGNQLQSTVADGTAPLIAASTTKVANLNSDRVDDLHASATATAGYLYALDGAGKWAIGVIPFDTTKGLENSGGNLAINLEDSNPTLKFTGGELGLKMKSGGGLLTGADGVYVSISAEDNVAITADTSALAVADWVYISGNETVAKADATDNTAPAIGVVTVSDVSGTIVTHGLASGLAGLTANTKYYLSETAGDETDTAPTATDSIVQTLGRGWDADTIFVNIDSDPFKN